MNNINNHTMMDINGRVVNVSEKLDGFDLISKNSGAVEFYGLDSSNGRIFVQFKHGAPVSYIYSELDSALLEEAKNTDSIGTFVAKNLAHKCKMDKFNEHLITIKPAI